MLLEKKLKKKILDLFDKYLLLIYYIANSDLSTTKNLIFYYINNSL